MMMFRFCLMVAVLLGFTISNGAADAAGCPRRLAGSDKQLPFNRDGVWTGFSYSDECRDVVHIMWAEPAGNWHQIDFDPAGEDWGYCIPYNRTCTVNMTQRIGADINKPYMFKSQSCRTYVFGSDVCSDWSSLQRYLPWGPDTCRYGFVWREASATDHVCVDPSSRAQVRNDNAAAASRISPTDRTWGPNTCIPGFVWREAFPNDLVCVTPEVRARTWAENADAWGKFARAWR